jgi:MYND finger
MSTKTPSSTSTTEEEFAPVDGSWVSELEAAKAELEAVLTSAGAGGAAAAPKQRRGELLPAYLRLCRAHSTLRQWYALQDQAKKGLQVCATYKGKGGGGGTTEAAKRVADWKARFKSYREQAGRELSVPSYLIQARSEAQLRAAISGAVERPGVGQPAIIGDMRLMEALVAHGAGIDVPVPVGRSPFEPLQWAPPDATPLLVVCFDIAAHDADHIEYEGNPTEAFLQMQGNEVDKGTECAMQLVRLGADLTRTLNLHNSPNRREASGYIAAGFDGKTPLQLAMMTKRPELVELMEQHLRYTPEERAEVVHCRCGSRLPWKACHGAGGEAPHYHVSEEDGLVFRVSPLAKCPCHKTTRTHYECCWTKAPNPAYLVDATGHAMHVYRTPRGPGQTDAYFLAKSELLSWDPAVYHGCLERLERDEDDLFMWTDLHWHLEEPELLRRASAWNNPLRAYCRDKGFKGEERARVLEKHRANLCAPCGRVGCDALEREPKEFQRCSRCKAIGYCSRECQKKDWAEHRMNCIEAKAKEST